MLSDTQFWRLIWKEYRTHRALWLVLLIAAPVLQLAVLALNWSLNDFHHTPIVGDLAFGLLAIAYTVIGVYALGCGATIFSAEHETGTFDFQRLLPANQPRVFWAKVGFLIISSFALSLLLWVATRGILVLRLPPEGDWFSGFGVLYLAEVLAWSVLCSLLIRQPLWGVVAAIGVHSVAINMALPFAADVFNQNREWPGAMIEFVPWRIGFLVILAVADVVVGRLWFDDLLHLPSGRLRKTSNELPEFPRGAELPAYVGQRQVGWSRLLWLAWRDGRWIIGAFLGWFVYLWFTRDPREWSLLLLPALTGSYLLGLFAFAPEQWRSRFRYLAERGCVPRAVWLSRQAVFLPPVVLMCAVLAYFQAEDAARGEQPATDAAFEAMLAALVPLLCYAAGQFAAMLFRSTVLAIAMSLGLVMLAFIWGSLMTAWLAPTWWFVGSLAAIALFVTWLKVDDWIVERRDRTARCRLWLGMGIPLVLLLVTCATYRVVQIPAVDLPPEWRESPQAAVDLSADQNATVELYRQAIEQIEVGNGRVTDFKTRGAQIEKAHPEWDHVTKSKAAFEDFSRDWLEQNSHVVTLLKEAHSRPAVPLALVQPIPSSPPERDWFPDKLAQLPRLMLIQARQSLAAGRLDETWVEIEVVFELMSRYYLQAAPIKRLTFDGIALDSPVYEQEHALVDLIVDWGRHPGQSTARVKRAIRQVEDVARRDDASRHLIQWQVQNARAMLHIVDNWKTLAKEYPTLVRHWDEESTFWWLAWRSLPWEQWRTERVLKWQAWLTLQYVDLLRANLNSNRALVTLSGGRVSPAWNRTADLLSSEERARFLALMAFDRTSVEQVLLHKTFLPPNIEYGLLPAIDRQFVERAEAYRATLLRLALADWHREHGRFPDSLDDLVPTYFSELPREPRLAGPFVYFANGVPEDVTQGTRERGDFRVIIQKHVPFLWTPGTTSITARKTRDNASGWEFVDGTGRVYTPQAALVFTRMWPLQPSNSPQH